MSIVTPKRKQRHVCYKAREVDIYAPIEETLMKQHGLTYSDLMKKRGIRKEDECIEEMIQEQYNTKRR